MTYWGCTSAPPHKCQKKFSPGVLALMEINQGHSPGDDGLPPTILFLLLGFTTGFLTPHKWWMPEKDDIDQNSQNIS